jgi:hypothetical protein
MEKRKQIKLECEEVIKRIEDTISEIKIKIKLLENK